MKKFITFTLSLAAILLIPFVGFAADNAQAICEGSGGTWMADDTAPSGGICSSGGQSLMQIIASVTDLLLFIIGAVAVVMLIIGGIRYAVSAGDQAAVTGAKNTMMYAIIGIVVAFLAYAIVHFVTGTLKI